MQLVSCHNGRLYTVKQSEASTAKNGFTTGLPALDDLLPGGALARGAIHELLSEPQHGVPTTFALLLAKAASSSNDESPVALPQDASPPQPAPFARNAIVWCDPDGTLYPPALAARGVALDQLFLLRPPTPKDLLWATAESLGCRGVGVTIAPVGVLSRIESRRLQLAAERGGGVGILLRPFGKRSAQYAAATRWLVAPHPGERTKQRWKIQLIHGHGGRVGQSVILEYSRDHDLETNPLRAFEELAHRPTAPGKKIIG